MTDINGVPTEVINHYNNLYLYRHSGQVLEAGKDWLDKEISDLETFLYGKEGQAVCG